MIDWSLQLSLPGGDEAILELERLWVDSLRAAARGEPLVRATSMIHSTRARTKLSLANVSLCSFYNHIINKVDDLEKCICTKKYIYICQTSSRVSWVSSGATKTIGPSIWLGDVPKASAPNWFSKLDLRCRLQLLPLLFCKAPYPWIGLRLPQGEPAISTSVWLRWNPPELGFALHIVTVGEATKKIIQDRTSAGRNNNSTSGKFFNAKAMREKEKKRLKKKKKLSDNDYVHPNSGRVMARCAGWFQSAAAAPPPAFLHWTIPPPEGVAAISDTLARTLTNLVGEPLIGARGPGAAATPGKCEMTPAEPAARRRGEFIMGQGTVVHGGDEVPQLLPEVERRRPVIPGGVPTQNWTCIAKYHQYESKTDF